jgi:hypothetical protein
MRQVECQKEGGMQKEECRMQIAEGRLKKEEEDGVIASPTRSPARGEGLP